MFWIKITSYDVLNNFFHHGHNKNECYPSLSIEPDSTSLSVDLSLYNDDNEDITQHIVLSDLQIKKWVHVGLVFNKNKIQLYINGTMKLDQFLDGDIKWPCGPKDSHWMPIYFSSPWNNTKYPIFINNFIWVPGAINEALIQNNYLKSCPKNQICH
jgi:hypothetical protein